VLSFGTVERLCSYTDICPPSQLQVSLCNISKAELKKEFPEPQKEILGVAPMEQEYFYYPDLQSALIYAIAHLL